MKPFLTFCIVGCAGLAFAAAPEVPPLRAGAATSNITPPLGSLRVGSFTPYPTEHVHDELHARCLVLDDGKTKLALVVCDLLGLHRSVSIEARRLIHDAVGIPSSHVLISATHTHSAGSALGVNRFVNDQELDHYQQFLARRIADGVRRAHNLLRPAQIAFGSFDAPEHLINRRWFLREGDERLNPFGKLERVWKTGAPGNEFTGPAGPIDPALSFIALREPDGRPISVFAAYSLHYAGDTGPAHVSADYFGAYCDALKRLNASPEEDPPFVALMANATSGDIGLNAGKFPPKLTRGAYQRSSMVANDLAARTHQTLNGANWKNIAVLDARFRELEVAWRAIEPELLEWAEDVEAAAPRLASGNLPIGARWPTTPEWVTRLSYAGRVKLLALADQPALVPLQVLRIGDICIATTPCETYAEIGLEFKRRSSFSQSLMVQLNHGYMGYLPTPPQFEFGEYSTWPGTNFLEPQASVKMLDALLDMTADVHE
ncbi:MAG: neutral/alkaline non-lysosomal ceramidase N-terminal domain-containing protein [Pirellulaceae bacterium]|nr:neutral/alkaline non-lysosomal ceramidase N-terminal domain-containing protein [Pirellulaceae bacterium]